MVAASAAEVEGVAVVSAEVAAVAFVGGVALAATATKHCSLDFRSCPIQDLPYCDSVRRLAVLPAPNVLMGY